MKVLVCGSRNCSSEMMKKVKEVVRWVANNGHSLIAGDAEGVDRIALMEMSHLNEARRSVVYGANGRLRFSVPYGRKVILHEDYLHRDRVMVREADLVVAIWDGVSRGTEYTFSHARKCGKKVIIRKFSSIQS
ncbi:MAG: hypothetical protein QY317_16575 [Candidatus Jettenia caeni]|nr:MAG: hypothetical protein QY317_16575 [Candidatus Jettenia caeni]